jgi:hypothetical protein
MGIESVFACNTQNSKELSAGGEKRFRVLRQPIMSEVSHAQRLPRQRLSANRQTAHLGSITKPELGERIGLLSPLQIEDDPHPVAGD